ncbi:SDR family NAD(P)-dependent oxidoreductase [Alteribacillus sp. HJP-4]|uniref:SDR family NAD(P)-dependent oxidoreductase n=1 Tax=Alteribacillus sp. HJP-4 TaxID=2775394 RepID=UPI0035CD338C
MQIKGKVFLVAGGAAGLGASVCEMIIEYGGRVIISDINDQNGKKLSDKLGKNAYFIKTDVTSEESAKRAVMEGKEKMGGLHGLINCARIGVAERIVNKKSIHSLEHFSRVIQINLVGTFNMLRLVGAELQHNQENEEGERGIVINTASIAAYEGQVGQSAYSVSKSGVVGLTLPAAREFASFGVRVMAIAPGTFDTHHLDFLPKEAKNKLGESTPFPKRLGQTEEFAMLVRQIIENPMLNGETIRLDGALRMPPK